jgi:prepilin-type N-terminal cleavage/methylation domain-containing protein
MRPAFTLVETLVALVLFGIGMLAVAASGAYAARELAAARATAAARLLARNRVETLRAVACGPDITGYDSTHARSERWTVRAEGASGSIIDNVDYALPRGGRGRIVIRAAVLCDR